MSRALGLPLSLLFCISKASSDVIKQDGGNNGAVDWGVFVLGAFVGAES